MNININKRLFFSACAAALSLSAFAQQTTSISGKVVDAKGAAIPGAAITAVGTTAATVADANGEFNITVSDAKKLKVAFLGYNAQEVVLADGQDNYNVVLTVNNGSAAFDQQVITFGAYKDFTISESTAAVNVIGKDRIDQRSAKNLMNSLIGQGSGLTLMEGAGTYFDKQPVAYVRGQQTGAINDNKCIFIVDGIEREVHTIVPADVEEVQILKDAAAVALFGYKGANNVIFVKTKRGPVAEGNHIHVSVDAAVNNMIDRPEFVDALTYAKARNEALAMEGSAPMYSEDQLAAFEKGANQSLYPNVNWVDEVFKKQSTTRRYNLQFSGRGKRFSYFTSLNLLANDGYINEAESNEGYSTQDMYSRGNLRSNLDIKLTDYTDLRIDISGVLSEMQRPGDQTNIWELVYKTPALAYPVKTSKGDWGGSTIWAGSANPAAQARGAGYYKLHERALNTDVVLNQSLEMFVEGLKIYGRLAYDNFSTLYEKHTKTYVDGHFDLKDGAAAFVPGTGKDLVPNIEGYDYKVEGTSTELGAEANSRDWSRRAVLAAGASFDRQFSDTQKLFAQVRWDYDFSDATGTNTTVHRHNITWYSHYGLFNRYYVDLALDASASNRLAPDTKWNFSPTVSAAWVISNEDFLASADAVNLLKLRASFGKISTDWLPVDPSDKDKKPVWDYYEQFYTKDSAFYPFGSDYSYGDNANRVNLNRMAAENPTCEKSYKFNVGLDARLFDALDVQVDGFVQNNKEGWVSGAGAYSAVIGFAAPFTNEGEYKSHGFEVSLDYNKQFGEVNFNLGGAFSYSTSEIVAQAEEPRAFPNLVVTGSPLGAVRGLKAVGLFANQAEIDAAPQQGFGTVRPGDIRYADVNGDGVVNENDEVMIAKSNIPEVNYNFHIGAEWKGLGITATFQGQAGAEQLLNTEGYYWGLYSNRNLSQEVYDNRWTPKNLNAKYPRLSSAANNNNYRNSDFWVADVSYLKLRNAEVYYDFKHLLANRKVLHGARLFVRGIDLLTIDNIDNRDAAQLGMNAPLDRSFAAGFSLTF